MKGEVRESRQNPRKTSGHSTLLFLVSFSSFSYSSSSSDAFPHSSRPHPSCPHSPCTRTPPRTCIHSRTRTPSFPHTFCSAHSGTRPPRFRLHCRRAPSGSAWSGKRKRPTQRPPRNRRAASSSAEVAVTAASSSMVQGLGSTDTAMAELPAVLAPNWRWRRRQSPTRLRKRPLSWRWKCDAWKPPDGMACPHQLFVLLPAPLSHPRSSLRLPLAVCGCPLALSGRQQRQRKMRQQQQR